MHHALLVLGAALASSSGVSAGVLHGLRLSDAALRPVGDLQLEARLQAAHHDVTLHPPYGVPAETLVAPLEEVGMPVGLRLGVTDWLEFGAGLQAFDAKSTALPFRLSGPSWEWAPAVSGHAAIGYRPGPAAAISLAIDGTSQGATDGYHRDTTGTLLLRGASALTRNLLVGGWVGPELVVPQLTRNYDGLLAGASLQWLGEAGGVGVGGSVESIPDGVNWSVGPTLVSFPTPSSEMWLGLSFGHSGPSDIFSAEVGMSLEPLTRP